MANVRTLAVLPHQWELLRDQTTPILGLCSGYGGGKTWALARKILTMMQLNPGADAMALEPTFPLLDQILIPELELALAEFGLKYKFNAGKMTFTVWIKRKKTRLLLGSLENYKRLIGINAAFVAIDEFDTAPAEIAYTAFQKLLGRMRGGVRRQMVIVSTPEGFRAMHRIFVKEFSSDKRLIKARTADNHHLPPDYIARLLAMYPANLIAAYLEGEFVNLNGQVVYSQYDKALNDTGEVVQAGDKLLVGMDFNIGKMAAIVYVERGDELHAVDELLNRYDTRDMMETLLARFEGHQIEVFPDASGKNRKTSSGDETDHSIIEGYGVPVHAHAANPSVRGRVNAVNAQLCDGKGRRRLFVNSAKCPNLVEALMAQTFDDDGEPEKDGRIDHPLDAFGYPIAHLKPIIRDAQHVTIRIHGA